MKDISLRKVLEVGGFVAAAVLIAFGVAAVVMGFNGRDTVKSNLAQEQIYFGDATKDSAVPAKYSGRLVDSGDEARQFALVMRTHALESSKGLTYAQMGRFLAKPGTPAKFTDGQGGTSIEEWALVDPNTKQPVSNPVRNLWVTETALSTALNLAYTAEQVSLFGIVVGVALLLSGIGFGVLAFGGALRDARLPKLLHGAGQPAPAAGGPSV